MMVMMFTPSLCIIIIYSCKTLFFSPVALQSLKDLGRLIYRRFLELFRHMVGLLGRVISPSQGHYLHRTTQHRKTRTNIHALSGIQTHDPSNQPDKTHASDRTATVTSINTRYATEFLWLERKRQRRRSKDVLFHDTKLDQYKISDPQQQLANILSAVGAFSWFLPIKINICGL
jgi:hypothetical protein